MTYDKILVLDFGSQYNQLIARRIREMGVYSELRPHEITAEQIKAIDGVKGLYKHILESMHVESVCNTMTYHVLCKIGNI